jgi:electron transfer flavoprotein beta subunit
LKIVVCIKQISDPEYFPQITLDPETGSIQRDKVPAILNPLDENALEEGLRIKEKFSGTLTVVTMGPPGAREVLDWALALGADEAVLLSDRAFAGADTLATAYTLAEYMRKMVEPDIILCGNQTEDGATGQVAPQIAELLNIPHVTSVSEVSYVDESTLIAKQNIEYGGYLKVKVKLPALLAVVKDINEVRDITAEGIMNASDKEFKTLGAADLEVDPGCVGNNGSPTSVIGTFKQEIDRQKEILTGTPQEIANKVLQKIHDANIL